MNLSRRFGTLLGAGLLTALLAVSSGPSAQAQVWTDFGIGGLGYAGNGVYGPGYGAWGAPGWGGLGYGGYGGYGAYNGVGYGGYNGLGYGGYGAYGPGLGGFNINLGGRNLLHIGQGVNPLWRGRGYYSRNWYGRDFDDWYDLD